MPLQILSELSPEPEEMKVLIKRRIEENILNSDVDVSTGGPGHFEITVESTEFEGFSRVKQQQLVYSAISNLMSGENPPVHAVDRMVTKIPSNSDG